MTDLQGRPYAKLSGLKEGDTVQVDAGFTCMPPGTYTVYKHGCGELCLFCSHGRHFLRSQHEHGDCLVGIYKA